jgi:hypothetical protein
VGVRFGIYRAEDLGSRSKGLELKVHTINVGFRVKGFRFGLIAAGLGGADLRISGIEYRVSDNGLQISDLGL